MQGRNGQVARIYSILSLLESSRLGMSPADITRELTALGHTVKKRTVYRDLELLEAAGFPLKETGRTEDGGKRWVLEQKSDLTGMIVMSPRDLLALYLAKSHLTSLHSTPLGRDIEQMFARIEEKLGERHLRFFRVLAKEVAVARSSHLATGIHNDIAETLIAACSEKQVILALYESASSKTTRERRLGPHFLYFSHGGLYLVAEDLEVSKPKVFALSRMKQVTMLDEPYGGHSETPESYFAGSFGLFRGGQPEQISITFSAALAPFIRERKFHATQSVSDLADGRLILNLTVAPTIDFVRWVMGFGGDVVSVKPESVARRITEELESQLRQLQSTSSGPIKKPIKTVA